MNEQLIEKLKELINDINTFEQINKKYTNSILSEAIQALTSVKTTIDEDKLAKAIREAEIMFEWYNKDGNPNRANGQKIILECLKDIQKSNFTSVKSESAEDKRNPYAKTPEEIAQWIIDNRYPKSEQEKVPDSEMYYYIVEAFQSPQPKEQLSAEEVKQSLEKKARDWEFQNRESEDSDYHSYRAGYNQAMHDFANNSEAMKENAIGFAEFCQVDEKCRALDDLYTEYLTNKEK